MSLFTPALSDLRDGLARHQLWIALASNDIRHRYRRSTLGPFWLTLSLAIMVAGMGPLYGALFGLSMGSFLPHLAAGLLFWSFMSGLITDSTEAFTSSAHHLRQSAMPLSMFVFRVYARHVLILLHNAVVLVIVLLIWSDAAVWQTAWMFVPGFLLVSLALVAIGMCLAIFCTRYRDMLPVVVNLMTVLFFVSPIVWTPDQLPAERRLFVNLNPLAQWLELLRAPLLGHAPSDYAIAVTAISAVVATGLALYGLNRLRHRVTYWL